MKPGTKRITVDLTDEEHEAFTTKCFMAKPRLKMSAVAVRLIRKWSGLAEDRPGDAPQADKPKRAK